MNVDISMGVAISLLVQLTKGVAAATAGTANALPISNAGTASDVPISNAMLRLCGIGVRDTTSIIKDNLNLRYGQQPAAFNLTSGHYSSVVLQFVPALASRRLNVTSGQTAVLHCNNTPGNNIIQWVRLNPSDDIPETTYTSGFNVIIRQRIQLDADDIKYNLHILNTTTEDSGLYRCAFIHAQRPVTHDVRLIVDEAPTIYSTDTGTTDYNLTNTTPFRTNNGKKSGLTRTTLYVIIGMIGGVIIVLIALKRCILTIKVKVTLRSDENHSSQLPANEHVNIYDEPENVNSGGQLSNNSEVNMEMPETVVVPVEVSSHGSGMRYVTEESYRFNNPYEPLAAGWSNYTHAYAEYRPQEERNMLDVNQGDLTHVYDECGKEPNRPCNPYQSLMQHHDGPSHLYQ